MKKGLLLFGLLIWWATACQQTQSDKGGKDKILEEIGQLEKQLLKTGDASKEKEAALSLVEKTQHYAALFPEDEKTPELLYKAADIARGAKEYGKAVQLWGQLWRKYNDAPKAPMALFLQGFTFDSELRDANMAKKYYRTFLKKYPNDSLATQVQQLLKVVEMTPEDLVKEFEKNR